MKVTLEDIAKKTGVTISTVQRALNNGGGVNEEKRRFIQKTAIDMGYKRHFYAASLQGREMRIAVVFPNTTAENKFFSHYLWSGIHRFANEVAPYHAELVNLLYDLSPEDHTIRLQEILDGQHGKVDGIVTRGSVSPQIVEQLRQLQERNIPVVLAGTETRFKHRLCCVRVYEQMAGSLAADMLLSFGALGMRSRVIVCGNFSGLDQFNNAQGFEREIWESGIHIDILKIQSDVDAAETRDNIRQMLISNKNIGAIYACSARSTIYVCEAVRDAGMDGQIRIIGSDLFQESVELLRQGRLSALVHNRPATVAYRSIQILANYIVSGKPLIKDTVLEDSAIVMRGNLDFYLRDIPALRIFAAPERISLFDD